MTNMVEVNIVIKFSEIRKCLLSELRLDINYWEGEVSNFSEGKKRVNLLKDYYGVKDNPKKDENSILLMLQPGKCLSIG